MHELNKAPEWLLKESAQMLGKIHKALIDYRGVPVGIGKNFFKYMTPEIALNSYKATLEIANQHGDNKIEADLSYRIELMRRFPNYEIDINRFSCQCTHGDYFIIQLILNQTSLSCPKPQSGADAI